MYSLCHRFYKIIKSDIFIALSNMAYVLFPDLPNSHSWNKMVLCMGSSSIWTNLGEQLSKLSKLRSYKEQKSCQMCAAPVLWPICALNSLIFVHSKSPPCEPYHLIILSQDGVQFCLLYLANSEPALSTIIRGPASSPDQIAQGTSCSNELSSTLNIAWFLFSQILSNSLNSSNIFAYVSDLNLCSFICLLQHVPSWINRH